MKNFKRIASLVLALTMILCMGVTAFAASITITADANSPTTGHTYEVYQIFTGTLANGTLSNIKYGVNYTPGDATTDTLVPQTELDAIGTGEAAAKAFATDLMNISDANTVDIDGNPVATLNGTNGYTVSTIKVKGDNPATTETIETDFEVVVDLPDGYYLIVDKGAVGEDVIAEDDSLSAYIVQVAGSAEITPKSETLSSDKDISGDDYEDNYNDNENENPAQNNKDNSVYYEIDNDGNIIPGTANSSNGAVGSTVNFTLTVNVPANAADYSYYYCVLRDILSEGLEFDPDSVVVMVGNETLSSSTDDDNENNDYTLYTGNSADGYTFEIAMLNAKDLAGKTITATYSATINEYAMIGVEGNPNTFDTLFSNDPNADYDDKDGNGKPDDDETDPIGRTPESTTMTYTTGVKLIKVDEDGNVLTGAEFEITGASVKYVLTSTEEFEAYDSSNTEAKVEDYTYWKLAGDPVRYTEEAPIEADKMEKKSASDRDGGYVIVTEEDDRYTADTTKVIGDVHYAVANNTELADNDVDLYKLIEDNTNSYASTTTKYKKIITYTVTGDDENPDTKASVGADGVVYFNGLGEGSYTITETVTPNGYNTIDPITLDIDWTAPDANSTECTWTAIASNIDDELSLNAEGVFEIEVVNVSGSNLPETGGIGTTIFYIAGGVLLVGAAVLLITKRRMNING